MVNRYHGKSLYSRTVIGTAVMRMLCTRWVACLMTVLVVISFVFAFVHVSIVSMCVFVFVCVCVCVCLAL